MWTGDVRETLHQKARDLFSLCDREGKGYATKSDLLVLRAELPLTPEQLDQAFEVLDKDGNGWLTLEEFTDGFGMFLGIESHDRSENFSEEDEDDDEMFEELLDHLGARNLFTDLEYVREMWRRVQKQDPVMLKNFEDFLAKMSADLKDSMKEQNTLQSTLKNRSHEHEAQVQSLYAEMEEQLRVEKEILLSQERQKEQRIRDEFETELELKDQQLQELLQKHEQMKRQLADINSDDTETKHENKKLQKDRDILENRLVASDRMLQDLKSHVQLLRQKSIEEKRRRAQAALKVSEGIALERENLVLELHHLKEVNKQLLDEKEELSLTATQQLENSVLAQEHRLRVSKAEVQKADRTDKQLDLKNKFSEKSTNNNADSRLSMSTTSECKRRSKRALSRSICSVELLKEECEDDDPFVQQEVQNNLNQPARKDSAVKEDKYYV